MTRQPHIFARFPMTPAERARGRFMRAPDHVEAGGGGTQAATGDNGGGNSATQTGESASGNNGGQGFDLSSFWAAPGGGESPSSGTEGSAGSGTQPSGAPNQQQPTAAQALVQQITSAKFQANIMTPDVMTQLNEGNTEGFQNQMNQFGREVMAQTVQTVIPLVRQAMEQMMDSVRSEMTENFSSRENAADLLAAIPSAKDPRVRPVVDAIFKQAMTVSKGNREIAINMTKEMLKLQAQTLGEDIGLPPPSAGDNGMMIPPRKENWLETLTGRS